MKITGVRLELSGETKVLAYCNVVIDHNFVIKDVKIIDGDDGPFVCMPSKKAQRACPNCHTKNVVIANYCNECGDELVRERIDKLYCDVCHPLNNECRLYIQNCVLREYRLAVADSVGCATLERVGAELGPSPKFGEGLH